MIIAFIRYLFPKRHPRERLPLLPLEYVDITQERDVKNYDQLLLLGMVASRSPRAARMLLEKHTGKNAAQIWKIERRKRRYWVLRTARRRWDELWR